MRDIENIEFRGKCTSQWSEGEWAYGCFVHSNEEPNNYMIGYHDGSYDGNRMSIVDEKTIGQYIGLKDENGVNIFEGDVISISSVRGGTFLCVVQWFDSLFGFGAIHDTGGVTPLMEYVARKIEVVGNIFDEEYMEKLKKELENKK